jgi:hypothetical protein
MEGSAGEAEQARPVLRRRATGRGRGKKGEEEEGGLTDGAPMSATAGKKKRREGDAGRCGEGVNGLVGRWAER